MEYEKGMMKMFTAEEARTVANNSKRLDRFVKRILRKVKHEARKGRYCLRLYHNCDSAFLEKVYFKLKEYGYTAYDTWQGYIYVSWKEAIVD